MFENHTKVYRDRNYKYVAMVRHKGTVIAFAMDDRRRMVYSVLNLAGDAQGSPDTSPQPAPFDNQAWGPSPTELIFPTEIAEIGFGVADQVLMPAVKVASLVPEPVGALLPAPGHADAPKFDYFLSTTARLSADAPFQVLSDGQFLYLFRQSIAADHADTVFQRGKDGQPLLAAQHDGRGAVIRDEVGQEMLAPLPLVDSSLLVDRFVLVGTQLKSRMEVRYQRSRSKHRPADRKDSLGPQDLDGNTFFEPTQELRFVGGLTGGRFHVLLLPTAVAETQRWHIFACKERLSAGAVIDSWLDSFNVERAADGLFNTLGTQVYTCADHPLLFAARSGRCALPSVLGGRLTCEKPLVPRLVTSGYGESALRFEGGTAAVELDRAIPLGPHVTWEAWIKPQAVATPAPQVLCKGDEFSLELHANSRLLLALGADLVARSDNVLKPGKWVHVAVTHDGTTCRFYADGKPAAEPQALSSRAARTLMAFGAKGGGFQGTIDEIRLWRRVRSGRELSAERHQRLTGLEPGLIGYWRFDEGAQTKVFDQSRSLAHGTINGASWTASDAPVGEHPGIERSSVRLTGRTLASGPTALLYFQQSKARTGYDRSQDKQLKHSGRVMLAVATQTAGETRNFIAALDFGVTGTGRLAQIPDHLQLQSITGKGANGALLGDQLVALPQAERNLTTLRTALGNLLAAKVTFVDANRAQMLVGVGTTRRGEIPADHKPLTVPPELNVTRNEADDTWTIEASDTQIAIFKAAEPDPSFTSFSPADIRQRIADRQAAIDATRALVKGGLTAPLVHTDALGFTVTGGILSFAWTKDAPLLFDSATGSLALYFRGSDDQFFVTSYATLNTRPTYTLESAGGAVAVRCAARSSEAELKDLTIDVTDGADGGSADLCTVTIRVPGTAASLVETWRQVPRAAPLLAKVLNGLAAEREFLGSGHIASDGSLVMERGLRRGLASGTTLMVGATRVKLREASQPQATRIPLADQAAATGSLPVFLVAYDYLANASIADSRGTAIASDLHDGSRLVMAVPSDGLEQRVHNQTARSAETISCQWTVAAPDSNFRFHSGTECGQDEPLKLAGLDAPGDLTLEAWVRPDPSAALWGRSAQARIVHHRTPASQYTLGLEQAVLPSALEFNGSNDGVKVAAVKGLATGNAAHTIEAWVRRSGLPVHRSWLMLLGDAATGAHHWLLSKDGTTSLGVFNVGPSFSPELQHLAWTHLASSFDGTTLRVYVNGALIGEAAAAFDLKGNAAGLPLTLALPALGENFFAGHMDEVRLWKRGRTGGEILADMNRRLGGNETDLVGYWHFDGRAASDFARHQAHGEILGAPLQSASPLKAYQVFAGVGAQVLQSVDILPTGNWTHLAATCQRAFGLAFDGLASSLDAGADATLDIDRDLTLEIFLQFQITGARQTLFRRGSFNQPESDPSKRVTQHPPYALLIGEDNKLIFAFEDVEQNLHEFKARTPLLSGLNRLAVTRERQSMSQDDAAEPSGKKVVAWDVITFHDGSEVIEAEPQRHEDPTRTQPVAVGNSNQALIVGGSTTLFRNGTATVFGPLHGTVSEIRIWNVARDQKTFQPPVPPEAAEKERADRTRNKDLRFVNRAISGQERGLVAWWRLREGSGQRAFDSKGQHHATIHGAAWVSSPDPQSSLPTLYINGEPAASQRSRRGNPPSEMLNQFALGALRVEAFPGRPQSGQVNKHFFEGDMAEVRVWQRARTQEQIQDNLFRRLLGEREDLIAYYTFTPDAQDANRLVDDSPRGNHLTIRHALPQASTAPIGDDAPQVRSALAGVKTTFSDILHSTPALQEYGDVQFDSQGKMLGVFKRCYGFVKNGEWQLITGFKVGDLVSEWIGQAQFAPQLMGYIEGAPPVPSENLSQKSDDAIGDLDDYNEASTVEIVEADETTYTYAASKARGFDMSLEASLKVGASSRTGVGLGLITDIEETKVLAGLRTSLEFSAGWKESASTSVGQTVTQTTSMELRGRFTNAEESALEQRRRFIPDNAGLALVKSETADVFALRLKHNQALIAYEMRPNPDIPKDWNIIHFPINPRYTKQGTLDGKIGMTPDASRTLTDPDYPHALDYSPDSSYFKPIEAYALKNRIQQTEHALKAYHEQYAAHLIGQRLPPFNPGASGDLGRLEQQQLLSGLPKLYKRNIVNTYVWTADGGLFAETQQTMDARSESFGGEWSYRQLVGLDLKVGFFIAKVGMIGELNAMFGGHLNLEVTKTQDAKRSFALNVGVGKMERDIYQRNEAGDIVVDRSDPKRPKARRQPGKVDAYRFMSFYLESKSSHHDEFYGRVIDPIWLEQSDDVGAVALRAAQQVKTKPPCWRVLHRVTYVSRVLPPLANNLAASSLERALQSLDVESNYELIKQLEPFVSDKLATPALFNDAVRDALARNLPELLPHIGEIVQYMREYLGAPESASAAPARTDPLEDAALGERRPNQPPLVSAGVDQTLKLDGKPVSAVLEGSVSDDRISEVDALFATWEQVAGDGAVTITDRHALKPMATFPRRGVYGFRLTVSDGQLSASDTVIVKVNEPPALTIRKTAEPVRQRDASGKTFWEVALQAEVLTGLSDPEAPLESLEWSEVDNVTFAESRRAANTRIRLTRSGRYLLTLTADNGSFRRDAQVAIEVAARAKGQLQAFYTFEDSAGDSVVDVSGNPDGIHLLIDEPVKVRRAEGGLALLQPTILSSRQSLAQATQAFQSSHEITIEAWLKPQSAKVSGLRRIITFSNGPAARNFTLGQVGGSYHVSLRTTTLSQGVLSTDGNASRAAMTAGVVSATDTAHLVCTRDRTGRTVLYLNGEEVGRRMIGGDFSTWDSRFSLALGNELAGDDGQDRSWLGELRLVALYSRALTATEVLQNFEFGQASGGDAKLPPVVSAGTTLDLALVAGQVTVPLQGRITTDRPSPGLQARWLQVAGPNSPDGVSFSDPHDPQSRAGFSVPGRYVLRLSAQDGDFLAADEVVAVVQPPALQVHLALTEALLTQALKPLVKDRPGLEEPGVTCHWQQTGGPEAIGLTGADTLDCVAHFSRRGVYAWMLRAEKAGQLWDSVPLVITVHQRPVLDVGANRLVTLPTSQISLPHLSVVSDSGLGDAADELAVTWASVSGDASVLLDAGGEATLASFKRSGLYALRCTAIHPHLAALTVTAELTVTVNQRPDVKIAPLPNRVVLLRRAVEDLKLEAVVSDDGLPNPELSLLWLRASGPGAVVFSEPNSAYTSARFSAAGEYVLQISADDGAVRASDSVTVVVHAPPVLAPMVALSVKRKEGATLSATITQTGLAKASQGKLTTTWETVSGPGGESIDDPQANPAHVSFASPGSYVFRVVANNGFMQTTANVQVRVQGPAPRGR